MAKETATAVAPAPAPAPVETPPASVAPAPTPVATDPTPTTPPPGDPKPTAEPTPVATDAVVVAIQAPEDSPLGKESVAAMQAFAEQHGLSQDQAQAMFDTSSANAQEWQAGEVTRRNAQVAEWEHLSMSDAEIGGSKFNETKRLAADFVQRFGSDAFRQLLHDTGYGSHPEVLRVFAHAAALVQEERTLVKPPAAPASTEPQSRADRMEYKAK